MRCDIIQSVFIVENMASCKLRYITNGSDCYFDTITQPLATKHTFETFACSKLKLPIYQQLSGLVGVDVYVHSPTLPFVSHSLSLSSPPYPSIGVFVRHCHVCDSFQPGCVDTFMCTKYFNIKQSFTLNLNSQVRHKIKFRC